MEELYEKAGRDVRHAAIVAFIVATLSFLVTSVALLSELEGKYGAYADPLNYADVALLVLLGLATLRFYRGAAIVLFLYYLISKTYLAISASQYIGLLVGLVFLFFLAKGIRGCFAYHRLRRQEDPSYRAAPRWSYVVAYPIGGLALLLTAFGFLIELGYLPDTEVVPGEKLSQGNRDWLRSQGLLGAEERILYFYSNGFFSITGHGSLLTDKRVVTYEESEGELYVSETKIEAIRGVEVARDADDTLVGIWTAEGEDIYLLLSSLSGGDERFLEALNQRRPPR